MCDQGYPVEYSHRTGPCTMVYETRCSYCGQTLSYQTATGHMLQIVEYPQMMNGREVIMKCVMCSSCGVVVG